MTDQRTPAHEPDARRRIREFIVGAGALTVATAIAWVDTRPNWDDTGVTVGALLLTAGVCAALGLRWYAAALLVVAPILAAELSRPNWSAFAAIAFTAAGALVGAGVRRIYGYGRVD